MDIIDSVASPRHQDGGFTGRLVELDCSGGVVTLGGRIFEVLPKVDDASDQDECRGVLLRLLREASDYPLFRHLTVGQNLRHAPLLDIFIAAFLAFGPRLLCSPGEWRDPDLAGLVPFHGIEKHDKTLDNSQPGVGDLLTDSIVGSQDLLISHIHVERILL